MILGFSKVSAGLPIPLGESVNDRDDNVCLIALWSLFSKFWMMDVNKTAFRGGSSSGSVAESC